MDLRQYHKPSEPHVIFQIFIGLFAGAQHKLKLEQRRNGGGGGDKSPAGTTTVISTVISTASSTSTQVTTATTTRITTTTMFPGPSPTTVPEKVSVHNFKTHHYLIITRQELCFSPQCIVLSASVLSSLDLTQDPCENFYDFASMSFYSRIIRASPCSIFEDGGWLRSHPLPADKSSFGKFAALSQQNKQVIQRILELNSSITSVTPSQDAGLLRKLRDFYSSCLNEHRLEDRGAVPLLDFIQTLRTIYRGGDMQIPSTKDSDDPTDITAALAYLHSRGYFNSATRRFTVLNFLIVSIGITAFFSFDIDGDVGVDPDHMIPWFSQSGLSLPSKVSPSPYFWYRYMMFHVRSTTVMKASLTNFRMSLRFSCTFLLNQRDQRRLSKRNPPSLS